MPKPENLKGKGFRENPQNINRKGRPKKLHTLAKENAGYTPSQVRDLMAYILTMTKKERAAYLTKDPDGLEAIIIRAIDKASAKGEYSKAKEIIDQVAGKAKNTMDMDLTAEVEVTSIPIIKWVK